LQQKLKANALLVKTDKELTVATCSLLTITGASDLDMAYS